MEQTGVSCVSEEENRAETRDTSSHSKLLARATNRSMMPGGPSRRKDPVCTALLCSFYCLEWFRGIASEKELVKLKFHCTSSHAGNLGKHVEGFSLSLHASIILITNALEVLFRISLRKCRT